MVPSSSGIDDSRVGNRLREAASEEVCWCLEAGTELATQDAPASLGCRHRRKGVAVDRIEDGMGNHTVSIGDFDCRLVAVGQPLFLRLDRPGASKGRPVGSRRR